MRIIRFIDGNGNETLGIPKGEDRAEVLKGELFAPLTPTGRIVAIEKLLAPLVPSNIYCIGLNYRAHADETGMEIPTVPVLFMKPTTTLNHPHDPVRIPKCCQQKPELDYEGELAVVIGQKVANVSESEALDFVFGYTIGNDVSARRWQKHTGGQWIRGKSFDTFCPLGPVLVTADEIKNPHQLQLETRINGRRCQYSSTDDMIFSVARLIAFISQSTTLLPGTVILTGTPHGVGFAMDPPCFLKAGDTVSITIDKIGELVCPVVNE